MRPLVEDEAQFRKLAENVSSGELPRELSDVHDKLTQKFGNFHDLLDDAPKEEDHELDIDLREEPDTPENPGLEGGPRKVRRRFYRSPEYWKRRNEGAPPLGPLHERPRPHEITDPSDASQDSKRRKVEFEENPDVVIDDGASPSIAPANEPSEEMPDIVMPEAGDSIPEVPGPSEGQPPDNTDEGMPPVEEAINTPVPEPGDDELFVKQEKTKRKNPNTEYVFEVGIDVYPEDVTDNELFLWGVLDECFQANTPKAKQRRVEVSFRKLNESDKELFRQAMKKEWQSWIHNKVVSLCKARGISPDRIIKARWVLVWKKSSDPDVKTKTPKARLVLVGWQDPELGRVATDSPTLRKETKSLVLSVCAAQRWTLWGADIKTAFLSGDASCRDIFFKPPVEVQEWMSLSSREGSIRLSRSPKSLVSSFV